MDFVYEDYPLEPLGHLCIELANSVNELARTPRSLPDATQTAINEQLGAKEPHTARHEIAKLPDDLATLTAQSAGGSLHALGQILTAGVTAPLSPAILARTVVETSAVVAYLCEPEDPLGRVTRAVNLMEKSLRDDKAAKTGHPQAPLLQEMIKIKQVLGQKGYTKEHKIPGSYENLAATYLDPVDGGPFYSQLNDYVHSNLMTQMQIAVLANYRPWENHLRTYDFSLATTVIVIYAAASLEPHRSGDPRRFRNAAQQVVDCHYAFTSDPRLKFESSQS